MTQELATTEDGAPITPAPSIEATIAKLADKGDPQSVEVLERLIALQERMEDRRATRAFFDALGKFQEERPTLTRKGEDVDTGGSGSKRL